MTTKTTPTVKSFAQEVWETLSKIDCSAHIEKKGQLSYLSWTWAIHNLMDHFPESTFEELEPKVFADGTMQVRTSVSVTRGDQSVTKVMWLPVMDNRNNAVKNPDARKVSDSTMRCLVKNIALHGLGLYIFAGEDVPQVEEEPQALPEPSAAQWASAIERAKEKIGSGAARAEDLINMMETRFTLTDAQRQTLMEIPGPAEVEVAA